MESSPSSTFFLQHKNLFEYDKYVGGGPITASSPSFLDRYRECDQHIVEESVASLAPFALETQSFVSPFMGLEFGIQRKRPPADLDIIHNPSDLNKLLGRLQSPSRLVVDTSPAAQPQASLYRPHQSPSKLSQRSPTYRVLPEREDGTRKGDVDRLPKLSDLLIDGSTRAGLLGASKRADEAKKVELLIGSKCVGRVSAAATSNLPPAIRRRLQASTMVNQRRERLYSVLKDEYNRLMGSS